MWHYEEEEESMHKRRRQASKLMDGERSMRRALSKRECDMPYHHTQKTLAHHHAHPPIPPLASE
jgi:hypothetical protein